MEPQAGINRAKTADTTFLLGKCRGLYAYPTSYRTGKMVLPIKALAADYCRQAMLEFHRTQKNPHLNPASWEPQRHHWAVSRLTCRAVESALALTTWLM